MLNSSSMELQRVSRKLRFADAQLKGGRAWVEEHVKAYEVLKTRQDKASEALNREEAVLNAVTEFLEKHPDGPN